MDAVAATGPLQCRDSGCFGKSRGSLPVSVCGHGVASWWRGFGGAAGVAEQLTATRKLCDKNDTGMMPRRGAAI
jgi:hypothetical protein